MDPFTGSTADGNEGSAGGQRPSGGAFGAMQNLSASNRPGSNMGNVDPYTGYSATQNGNSSSENEFYPLKEYLVIFKPNIAKDVEKVEEFEAKTKAKVKLSTESLKELKKLDESSSSMVNKNAITELLDCLLTWEVEFVFPFFDICVQLANSKSFRDSVKPKLGEILSRIASFAKSSCKPTQTMAMRFLANFTGSDEGCEILADEQHSMTGMRNEAFSKYRFVVRRF